MMFWLVIAISIAFIVGTLSWISPTPRVKALAKLRELAMQSGWLIKRQTYADSEKHQINWRDYSHELMRYSWPCDTPAIQKWAVCHRFGHWQWVEGGRRGHVPSNVLDGIKELPEESCMVICGERQMTLVWVESTEPSPQEVLLKLEAQLELLRTIKLAE